MTHRKVITYPTKPEKEKAFLVGIELFNHPGDLSIEDSLQELSMLCDTAGLEVVGKTYQKLDKINPNTYIGSGKVEEIKVFAEELLANVIVFDDELSPRHLRELEELLGNSIRILDRTAVILDIFAQHAQTKEGKLQVELAQYEYRLPRLTRAWTHLARQAGGGGGRTGSVGGVGLRGPGETQLEVDRREIHKKISNLKSELEKVRAHRARYRQNRKRSQIPTVSLVGYTNAGKSTLLNYLSHANVYVADQLFATLDPTTRRIDLPGERQVLFTDTVGFIQKLPTQLIAAFRATLEEISESDLLLHVVDITHPNAINQWEIVHNTLIDIGAGDIPVITALNKIDLLPEPAIKSLGTGKFFDAIPISALSGEGIDHLLETIKAHLFETFVDIYIHLPYHEGKLISLIHDQGHIKYMDNRRDGVYIHGRIPGRLISYFQSYKIDPSTETIKG